MQTDCTSQQLTFQGLGRRQVVADFTGGRVTSDGGLLLLREVAARTGLLSRFAACFEDFRVSAFVEHGVEELVSQRVLGLAQGYEDLNDHDVLRRDALLAASVGKSDPTGDRRRRSRDRGQPLASRSTLNRLELTPETASIASRYKKITHDPSAIDRLLVEVFLDSHEQAPEEIILDLDATDDTVYGHQEGRHFHGHYGSYCYLPLYITCGDFVLCARLRSSSVKASSGAVDELERIVAQIRSRWPRTKMVIRGDADYSTEAIMAWCEANSVSYVLGQQRNKRLTGLLEQEMSKAQEECEQTGEPARRFLEFGYKTMRTWSRFRRVIGKAEYLPGKANPRFVVTNLPPEKGDAAHIYEQWYCPRGDMENRIKEQQLGLFADRTSTHQMRSNQLRLYFSTIAYTLFVLLRRYGLEGTEMARGQAWTIRARLLKVGAIVRVSVRRVHVALSSVFPLRGLFARVLANLVERLPLAV